MIELGNYNKLTVLRNTSVGLFLGDEDVDDLLLPTKYVPEDFEIGQEIEVFCYLDHEERPIATTLRPFVKRNSFAYLRVAEVNEIGAFVDWGLEKNLLVPYREQEGRLEAGSWAVVYCYLDEKSFRLAGSTRLNRHFSKEKPQLSVNEEVDLLAYRRSDLGWDVIVNDKYRGLIFHSDVFRNISVGDALKGYVKNVRPDNKIDIVLQPVGLKALEPAAEQIYRRLQEEGGYLGLSDASSPEDIRAVFPMSKKTFKKAIGTLYKARKIDLSGDGIRIVK
ncbi:CvfB family protein [Muriicola marianensis]|uniref:GntR family transcriptional regulator n=1 Tax=Muriicola marianensis TaxID=1324801 RepID=A0ABQ1QPZ5_9FLAO|nr:S1-like domain-containing RNA-binding protein [Muriicola marianensis]GGD37746.1 GntR family transcriptional regulator [Muriicola marianensis]